MYNQHEQNEISVKTRMLVVSRYKFPIHENRYVLENNEYGSNPDALALSFHINKK